MAPRTKAAGLICNSCRSSLVRKFSSAAPRQNRIFPSFAPTSQPELDALLSQYREEIFVPENLSKAHRRLMYRPTKHSVLTNDPGVVVSFSEEEEIKLEPKFMTERPEKRKSMARIAQLLGQDESIEAWSNLQPFLEGIKSSHWALPPYFLEQITRKANKLGFQRLLVECAEQAENTGAVLSDPYFTRELLHGCHRRAVEASFKGDVFDRAARQAQHTIFLLERTEHCGPKKTNYHPGHYNMRRSLFVNSVQLELTAAHTLFASDKPTDTTGEVGRGVARVLALSAWSEPGLPAFSTPEFPPRKGSETKGDRARQIEKLGNDCQRLENLLPLWSGLKFAGKIPGAVLTSNKEAFAKRLTQVTDEVNKVEAEVKKLVGKNLDRRSLDILNRLRSIHA